MGVTRRALAVAIAATVLGAAAHGDDVKDVWLDVDVAAGLHERDVDDALAMIQAFHSPELRVRGVSSVYGNAPLADGYPIAREVAAKFGPAGLKVYPGAASRDELGTPTDASEALAAALEDGPLTILALGPLTNIGTLLKTHPEARDAIESIVIVAARRPGQRFTYPTAGGVSFRDFNFENDPAAMQILLDSDVDLVFTPWEVSSHVWITEDDLAWLKNCGGSGAWIAGKSQSWIAMWLREFKTPGFNPFDTLAVGWMTHPQLMSWMLVTAHIEERPDDTVTDPNAERPLKPYLLVEPVKDEGGRSIRYVYRPDASFARVLVRRLAGVVEARSAGVARR